MEKQLTQPLDIGTEHMETGRSRQRGSREYYSEQASSDSAYITTYLNKIGKASLYSKEQEIESAVTIEAGINAASLLQEGHVPDEADNLRAIQEAGLSARNKLVEANLRLAYKIAANFHRAKVPRLSLLDLIQVGNEGLIRAANEFDYRKGYRFSTFASNCILNSLRHFAPQDNAYTMSRKTYDNLAKVKATSVRLQEETGREPSIDQLAEATGLSARTIKDLMFAGSTPLQLNQKVDGSEDGDLTLGDVIAGEPVPYGEEIANNQLNSTIEALLDQLPDNDKAIIEQYFGFTDKSDEEFAAETGLSRAQINGRQKRIVDWLLTYMQNAGLDEHMYAHLD